MHCVILNSTDFIKISTDISNDIGLSRSSVHSLICKTAKYKWQQIDQLTSFQNLFSGWLIILHWCVLTVHIILNSSNIIINLNFACLPSTAYFAGYLYLYLVLWSGFKKKTLLRRSGFLLRIDEGLFWDPLNFYHY